MSKPLASPTMTSAVQAANVLKAWVHRDQAAFRREISATLDFCSQPATALDEEQLELLRTVAAPLSEMSLDAKSEPLVHLCMDLLIHLAADSASGFPPAAARATLHD